MTDDLQSGVPSLGVEPLRVEQLRVEQLRDIQLQLRSLSTRVERAESLLGLVGQRAPLPDIAHMPHIASVGEDKAVPNVPPPFAPPPAQSPAQSPFVPLTAEASPLPIGVASSPARVPPGTGNATSGNATSGEDLGDLEEFEKDFTARLASSAGQSPTSQSSASQSSADGVSTRPARRLIGDWENLIGGKWALWVGVLSLFLALASFLAYTWKSLPPMPPSGRVALGVAAGAALIGAGGFFRSRTQHWFSEGLAGAGLAVLYLSVWAGAQHFHLMSFGMAFSAMALITALGVYLALRFDALSLSILATLGGFLTPLLLQDGHTSSGGSLSLLTYVAVLNAGILAVSLFKRWNALTWLSFVATLFLVGAWTFDHYGEAQRWPVFAYFTVYFLLFMGASCFYSLARREQTAQPDLLLLFAATSVYALAGYGVLDGAMGKVPSTFALALMVFFTFLCMATRASAPENRTLRQSAAGLALLFLTVAVPIQFQQQGLAVGWCVEGALLLLLGLRLRGALLQRAGQLVWCLSLLPLLGVLLDAAPKPQIVFFNARALPLLVSVLMTALVVVQQWHVGKSNGDAKNHAEPMPRDVLAPFYAAYATFGGAWLLAQETFLWFGWHRLPANKTWEAGALCVIAAILAVYVATGFALGARLRNAAVRNSAMGVMLAAMTLPMWTQSSFSMAGWMPFWNLRWLSYLVVALALGAMGWVLERNKDAFSVEESETFGVWPAAVSLFALAGSTIEIYCGFGREAVSANSDWQLGAFFSIVLLWSVFAAVMLYLAATWRQPALRTVAMAVGALGCLLLLTDSVASLHLAWTPLFNLRALAFAVTVAMLGVMAVVENASRKNTSLSTSGASASTNIALLAVCVLLWGLTQETYQACRVFHGVFGGHWKLIAFFGISALWNAGMFVLLRVGLRRHLPPFRLAAYSLAALSSALLLWTALDANRLDWTPFFNARGLAFGFAVVVLGAGSALLGRHQAMLAESERKALSFMGWAAGALLLWGLTQETHETCFYLRAMLGAHWDRWAQVAISFVWSGFGAALLIGGINRNFQPVRLVALALLAGTVSKVFLFDLGFLDGPLRMLSLAGLGIALIFISWLYGRFANTKRNSATQSGATQDGVTQS